MNPFLTFAYFFRGGWFSSTTNYSHLLRYWVDIVRPARPARPLPRVSFEVGGLILVSAFASIKAAVQSIVGRMVAWTFTERFPNSRMTWRTGGGWGRKVGVEGWGDIGTDVRSKI